MNHIDMSEWNRFGEGGEGSSYYHKTNPDIMLKLFDMRGKRVDVEPIAKLTNEALALGISTPAVIDVVENDEGRTGIVFERLQNKISLFRRSINYPETLQENARLFGGFLRELHKIPCTSEVLPKRMQFISQAPLYMMSQNPTYTEEQKAELSALYTKLIEPLYAADQRSMCLMGDCHTGNVVLSNDKLYLIDLGFLSSGDPKIELAYFWRGFTTPFTSDTVKPEERMSEENKVIYWDTFARAYWQTEDEEEIAARTAEIAPLGKFLDVLIALFSGADFETVREACQPL